LNSRNRIRNRTKVLFCKPQSAHHYLWHAVSLHLTQKSSMSSQPEEVWWIRDREQWVSKSIWGSSWCSADQVVQAAAGVHQHRLATRWNHHTQVCHTLSLQHFFI